MSDKTFFLGKIYRMTPQQHETAAAQSVLGLAQAHAGIIPGIDPRDIEAQTIAILLTAFDLATQGLSIKAKRALLNGENE